MRINGPAFALCALLVSLGAKDDEIEPTIERLQTYASPTSHEQIIMLARQALQSHRKESAVPALRAPAKSKKQLAPAQSTD
jgi:hypothetical protein